LKKYKEGHANGLLDIIRELAEAAKVNRLP